MGKLPSLHIGIVIYLAYMIVFVSPWIVVGADYTNLVGRDVILSSLILPLVLGASVLIPVVTWLGWWQPVMFEKRKSGPTWTMWGILLIMTAMIATGLITTSWTVLSPSHIALIGLGAILVGFNEELLCRGILIIGARGVIKSEIWVCGVTAILFGLLHVPNGFFGLGPIGASIQVVFATCVGLGFYVLRSVSGSLFLPMLMHGAWDFASFTREASDVVASSLSMLFQFATYFVALVAVTCLLRTHRNQNRTSAPL